MYSVVKSECSEAASLVLSQSVPQLLRLCLQFGRGPGANIGIIVNTVKKYFFRIVVNIASFGIKLNIVNIYIKV